MKKFLFSKNWNFPKSIPPLLPWEKNKMRIVKKTISWRAEMALWNSRDVWRAEMALKKIYIFPRRLTSWDGTLKFPSFCFCSENELSFFWKNIIFGFSFSRAKPKVRKRDAFEKIVFSNVKIRKSHHKSRKSNFEEVTFFAKSHLERGGWGESGNAFFYVIPSNLYNLNGFITEICQLFSRGHTQWPSRGLVWVKHWSLKHRVCTFKEHMWTNHVIT